MKIKIIREYIEGILTTGKFFQLVVIIFVVNLALALILAVPLANSFRNHLGSSLTSEKIVENFDYVWWQEYRDEAQGLAKTVQVTTLTPRGALLDNLESLVFFNQQASSLPPVILLAMIIYGLVQTFLTGGLLATYHQERPPLKKGFFFQQSGVFFARLLGLMAISWVFFLVIYQGIGRLFHWFERYLGRTALSERPAFYVGLVTSALLLFLIFFLQMLFDYARIHTVVFQEKNILKATWRAWKVVGAKLGQALGLYYLILASLVIFTLIMTLFREALPEKTALMIIVAWLLQQILILGTIWFRCWLYASQIKLYQRWTETSLPSAAEK